MGLSKWIISKGVWYALSVAAILGVGNFFNILPQSLKDFLAWLRSNASELLLFISVLVVCYTIVKVTGRKERGTA